MKRFKYYKTEQGLYFQDNLENKLLYFVDGYTSKFKENWTIESNRLFEELNWKEQEWILKNINHDDIYGIADETNENLICDIFSYSFIEMDEKGENITTYDISKFIGNESDFCLVSNKYKEILLKYDINHFLNS